MYYRMDQMSLLGYLAALQTRSDVIARIVVGIAELIRCHRQEFCRYSRVDQMSLSRLLLVLQNGSDVIAKIFVVLVE